MLTNLLPGIREMRAPLVAGYLWLIAAWIVVEPHASSETISEVTAIFYRLGNRVTPVVIGVIASCAAYLVGSLSVTLFGTPLRLLFQTDLDDTSRRSWSSLSPHSKGSVIQLARESRKRLQKLLALSDTRLKELLDECGGCGEASGISMRQNIASVFSFLSRRRFRHGTINLERNSPAPPPPERDLESWLARAVVGDLDVVTSVRLLGKDPELYSAIDRSLAEVEFRLAVIPPILAAAAALAFRLHAEIHTSLQGAIVLAASFLICVGLHWDALKNQRNANDFLVDAIVDGRVKPPTLEKLENNVREVANQSKTAVMESAARRAADAISRAIEITDKIDSAPSRAYAARDAICGAKECFAPVESVFPALVADRGQRSLAALEQAVNLWIDGQEGRRVANWTEQVRVLNKEAKDHYESFRLSVRDELHRLTSSSPD